MKERSFPRFPVELHVHFSRNETPGEGTVYNLSYGGCAVRSNHQPAKGAYLQLQILLPDFVTPLHISLAPVRWVARNEFGLEFITISPRDQVLLRGYIAALDLEEALAGGGHAGGL